MEGLLKVTPNKKKSESMLKMAEITLEMTNTLDISKYSSNIAKDYYDIIRELMGAILLLEGYKTIGEGAHKVIIEYFFKINTLTKDEYIFLDNLRDIRNRITYDGFFIEDSYIHRNKNKIEQIILKLKTEFKKKINI